MKKIGIVVGIIAGIAAIIAGIFLVREVLEDDMLSDLG